ncbi:MAG: hypothetical protein LDLANPLL_00688 [Turneriella sp.]|nr:hypothetical protein [Turneriella sp.]
MDWRFSIGARDILFRSAAFLWGFTFFLFFRYLLEKFFPYFRGIFPLTLFALLLFGIAFLAAALYKVQGRIRWKLFILGTLVSFAVGACIITLFTYFHTKTALLYFPIPLILLSLYLWYELSRYAFSFHTVKPYLIVGIIVSLFVGRYLENPLWAIILSLAVIAFTRTQPQREFTIVHERLLTLRQLIDFLRYLFLAQAFHSILELNREHLLYILIICAIGFVLPLLIQKFGTLRPRIQQGLTTLPIIFSAIAFIFNLLPYPYVGAIAYLLLALWEAIYFGKSHEIYLRREKILAGLAIFSAILAYYIASEWMQILLGILILIFLSGILFNIAKKWRRTITALFSIAVLLWGYAVQEKYSNSVTRVFFRSPPLRIHKPQLPDVGLITAILTERQNLSQRLYTNILPHELYLDNAWQKQNIGTFDANPAFLTLRFIYECYVLKEDRVYILDEKSLEHYAEPLALVSLSKLFNFFGRCNLFITDGKTLRSIKNLGQILSTTPAQIASTITLENAPLLLSLARAEKRYDLTNEAYLLYEQVFPFYKNDTDFLRELSALAATRGLLDRQIEILNLVVQNAKDNTLYDKKMLMELYALKNDKKKSAAMAYEILAADTGESSLAIYAFLQKLFSEPFDRYEMEALYRKISTYKPKTDLEELKLDGLKRLVEEQMKQNPTGDLKFRDENHRQEFITFPE